MMNTPFSRSDHYRTRAEECRAVADTFVTDWARKRMLRVADDYERMATALNAERSRPASSDGKVIDLLDRLGRRRPPDH